MCVCVIDRLRERERERERCLVDWLYCLFGIQSRCHFFLQLIVSLKVINYISKQL